MNKETIELINNAYIHDYLYTLFVYNRQSQNSGELEAEYYRFKDSVNMMRFMQTLVDSDCVNKVAFVIIKPREQLQ